MIAEWAVYPAALLIIGGAASYIRDIYKGRVQPNLVTWFLWTLAPMIAFAAQIADGVGAPAVLTLMVGLCPLAVFVAGLRKGTFRPVRFDWWCGGVSIIALALWQITGNGAVGVGFSILADSLGAAPTLRKSYLHPKSESPLFFGLFAVSAGVTVLTIREWTIQTAAFSLYILVLYVVLYALVKFRLGTWLKGARDPSPANEPEGF